MSGRGTEGSGREEIAKWVAERIAKLAGLNADQIHPREPFASYGIDSASAVEVARDLSDWVGCELTPTLLWDCPHLQAVVQAVERVLHGSEGVAGSPSGEVVPAEEPMAIIGMGCRFPGAASPGEFWDLLCAGRSAVGEAPRNRSVPEDQNRGGYLQGDVHAFDAAFFGIAPREARALDPQQRLLLETAYEALEDAGIPLDEITGTSTGVFVGISSGDHGRQPMSDETEIDLYDVTGNAFSIAANRLSYLFDLRGPSVAVDTACSSSLVAVHLACQSLQLGECQTALVGGVNLLLEPALTVAFARAGMLAPDGLCKTFDASANGYVRGEGAGVIVLKPLSRASADGDHVYAVIRGSAVNQDGRSNGLTAPNRYAQEQVLQAAYRRAGVVPGHVQYVETHGTGTPLGDPIEVHALGSVLAAGREAGSACLIGSVKTNIGHLEAAAGIAGLMKAALALEKGMVPPSLHMQTPNPHISFERLPVRVATELMPWPTGEGEKLAGVSSFGFGGTNAHVVLQGITSTEEQESARRSRVRKPHAPTERAVLVPLSAKHPTALCELAAAYAALLQSDVVPEGEEQRQQWLQTLAQRVQTRRSHFEYRMAIVGSRCEELVEQLQACARREQPKSRTRTKTVFVFSGQGTEWAQMGRELLAQEPVFRRAVEEIDRLLMPYTGESLLWELRADATRSKLKETAVAQPAIFAVQMGLVALWRSAGVVPDAVVGHSVGEVAAACAAGVLTLQEAVQVIYLRSQAMQSRNGQGKMAMVELRLAEARAAINGYEDLLAIAAHNAPSSTVLSGDASAMVTVLENLQGQDVYTKYLPVNYAFHSHQMDGLEAELIEGLSGLDPRLAEIPIYSTVRGKRAEEGDYGAAYWWQNVRGTVLFAEAVQELIQDGFDLFVEIAPHNALGGAIRDCLRGSGREGIVIASMRRGERDREFWLKSLGDLYQVGLPIDWRTWRQTGSGGTGSKAAFPGASDPHVSLPSYPWQRETYRSGAQSSSQWLSEYMQSALPGGSRHWKMRWEEELWQVESPAFSKTLVEEAARDFSGGAACTLSEWQWVADVPQGRREGQVVLVPVLDGVLSYQLYSRSEGGSAWTLHVQGLVRFAHHAGHDEVAAAREQMVIHERASGVANGAVISEVTTSQRLGSSHAFAIADELLQLPPMERQPRLTDHVRSQVESVIGMLAKGLDVETPLHELGLDSIMAVELRNRFEAELQVEISLREFLRGASVVDVAQKLLEKWEITSGFVAGTHNQQVLAEPQPLELSVAEAEELLGRLDTLSDLEVDQILGGLLAKRGVGV